MKKPRPKNCKSQLDKFAEAARRVGADESEDAGFVFALYLAPEEAPRLIAQ